MDAVLFSPDNHFTVLQIRREFNLVSSDVFSANSSNRFFHQRDREVGNTDPCQTLFFFGFSSSACMSLHRDLSFATASGLKASINIIGTQFFAGSLQTWDQFVFKEIFSIQILVV